MGQESRPLLKSKGAITNVTSIRFLTSVDILVFSKVYFLGELFMACIALEVLYFEMKWIYMSFQALIKIIYLWAPLDWTYIMVLGCVTILSLGLILNVLLWYLLIIFLLRDSLLMTHSLMTGIRLLIFHFLIIKLDIILTIL